MRSSPDEFLFAYLGGAPGNIQVRWRHEGGRAWRLLREPSLTSPHSLAMGDEFGGVAFVPSTQAWRVDLISRHLRTTSFEIDGASEQEACEALFDRLARATFNPMWVTGFDDRHGAACDMRLSAEQPDSYMLEWLDRIGVAINGVYEALASTRRRRPTVVQARANLNWYASELSRLIAERYFELGNRYSDRLLDLLAWAEALLAQTAQPGAAAPAYAHTAAKASDRATLLVKIRMGLLRLAA